MKSDLDIFPVGSCRVNDPIRSVLSVKIPKLFFSHSSKEALFQLEVLLGIKQWPFYFEHPFSEKYCASFNDVNVLVIEVCTNKVFYANFEGDLIFFNNAFAENIRKDLPEIDVHEYTQSSEEIIKDIGLIAEMFDGLIYLIGHNAPPIPESEFANFKFLSHLIDVRKSLNLDLKKAGENCSTVNYIEINEVYDIHDIKSVLSPKEDGPLGIDLNHYQPSSFNLIGDFILEKINQ